MSVVVVVDDDESARHAIAQMLRLRGFEVQAFSGAEEALGWRGMSDAVCVVTDVKMPGMGGEELLGRLRRAPDSPPVIMVTGHGDVAMAVRCLKAGAFDFVEKPFDDDVLVAYVAKAAEQSRLSREAGELRRRLSALEPCEDGCYGMVGRSRPMQEVYAQIAEAARSDAPVLVTGETGTGKELVARAIHAQSSRSRGPFVPVNAGALPETMLESELFGHARGAFTGAVAERDGKLVLASGGTLLLDEIEAISSRAQVQLLRVLDDGIIEALGSDRPRRVDVRLLTASNADLEAEVRGGTIREDFYHRIMVLSIHLPPLRDRREDIPMLAAYFLGKAAARAGKPVPSLPAATLEQLVAYQWPGNVRELKNAVERMAITARGAVAGAFAPDLRPEAGTGAGLRAMSLPAGEGRLREEMERVERKVIEQSLREHRGDLAATWRALGISRRGLYERMRRYGLERSDYRG